MLKKKVGVGQGKFLKASPLMSTMKCSQSKKNGNNTGLLKGALV